MRLKAAHVSKRNTLMDPLWLTFFGILVVIIYYVIITRKKEEQVVRSATSTKLDIVPLSIEQARQIVEDLITVGEKLFVEPANKNIALPKSLGPTTREFFSKYRAVRTHLGGFVLDASEIHSSEYARGYTSIGHSEDWDVVQRCGDDKVYVVEGSESHESEMEVCFPSVYHLVLNEVQNDE